MRRITKRLSGGGSSAAGASNTMFERTVMDLPDLIRNQDWKAIRTIFVSAESNSKLKHILQRYMQQSCTQKEEEVVEMGVDGSTTEQQRRRRRCSGSRPSNLLSWACKFHPPLDVIVALSQIHPRAVGTREQAADALLRRYPIHVACRSGASPTVVAYLARCHPLGVCAQDIHGKTPLHLAAEYYGKNYDPLLEKQHVVAAAAGSSPIMMNNNMADPSVLPKKSDVWTTEEAVYRVVSFLCHLKPSAVNLEDNLDRTALELAIELETCPFKAVKKMQKASEKDWKRRVRQEQLHQQEDDTNNNTSSSALSTQSMDAFMKQHVQEEQLELEERLQNLATQDLAYWQKQMVMLSGGVQAATAEEEQKQNNTPPSSVVGMSSSFATSRKLPFRPRKKKSTTRAAHAA